MHPAVNLNVERVLSSVSGSYSECNQPANFQGRASSCVSAGSFGNTPSVAGKQPPLPWDYSAAVTLADRTTTECRNIPSRFAHAMPTPAVTAEYTSRATGNRDNAETVNDSPFCSEADGGWREQLKRLLDSSLLYGGGMQQTSGRKEPLCELSEKALLKTILLAKDLYPEIKPDDVRCINIRPGFLQTRKYEGLVKDALNDFFKNSTHDFSPVSPVSDQLQRAEQLLQRFAQTKSGQRLYRKAVANNMVALESLLRGAGVDINHQSPKSGNTPIMAAALANRWTMVSLLLDAKASVHQQNKSDYHLLELIFNAWLGYKITDEQQQTFTLKALRNQPEAQIKLTQNGQTKLLAVYAFQYAVMRKCWSFCNALLKENPLLVSVLKQYQTGSKLIMDVVTNYRDPAAATTYLVNLKDANGRALFNLNCKNLMGETLLMLAIKKGNTHTVNSLLNAPDILRNINDSVVCLSERPTHWTAYTYAHYYSEYYQNRHILRELMMHGAEHRPASRVKKREPDSSSYGHSYHFGGFSYGDDGGC